MQLVSNPPEGRPEIVGRGQLEIAPTGRRRDFGKAGIHLRFFWRWPEDAGAQATEAASGARAAPAAAGELSAGETDGENHNVFLFGVLLNIVVADVVAAHRVIDAVGEHENDATPFLVKQRRDADIDRIPERRRPRLLQ